ncbi:MAG: iron ABC transporter permease [Odoribacter sp.]
MYARYYQWIFFLLVLFLLLAAVTLVALCIGEVNYTPGEVLRILFGEGDDVRAEILRKLRLPRILLGLIVGGSLSLTGAILQGIFRNPLVEPYTLGISGGASVGIALVVVFSLETLWGSVTLPLAGFAGALVTIVFVYAASMNGRSVRIQTLLLTGVMISFIASSVMMMLMSMSRTDKLQGVMFWIMGGLNETNTLLIGGLAVVAFVVLLLSCGYAPALNAMRLGVERATQLGVNAERSVKVLFFLSSILTGICVSLAGVIGFVGLIIPQLIRYIIGTDYRILLISSFLGGGIFLILCDIFARVIISPNELPIGVVTGIIGGIIFIVVMMRKK